MELHGNTNEFIILKTINHTSCSVLQDVVESNLTILWFQSEINILIIDGKEERFTKNQIVFLTEFHHVVPKRIGVIRFTRFNRPFYCILDNDDEVGCKGVLFFGAAQLPIIYIPETELVKFETLWKMFTIEMEIKDNLQIEMLQMMLKRYIILGTRLYKLDQNYPTEKKEIDLIREFNFLVEQHFRAHHSVTDYAKLLYKSPKTLSNIFSQVNSKTPLQYIQERIMLEARRLLKHTDKPVKEIAYEIGFDSIQSFSRFFKKQEGISPTKYKEREISIIIANT